MKYNLDGQYIGEKKSDGFYCRKCGIFSLRLKLCLNCFTECDRMYSFVWENISYYFQIKRLKYEKDRTVMIKDSKGRDFFVGDFVDKVLSKCPLPYLPKIKNAIGRNVSTLEFQLEIMSCS